MAKVIIHEGENGGVCVMRPLSARLTIEEVAQQDVPEGADYKIIDESLLPDREVDRNSWAWSEFKNL